MSQAKDVLLDAEKRRDYDKWRRSEICIPYDTWKSMSHVKTVRFLIVVAQENSAFFTHGQNVKILNIFEDYIIFLSSGLLLIKGYFCSIFHFFLLIFLSSNIFIHDMIQYMIGFQSIFTFGPHLKCHQCGKNYNLLKSQNDVIL